MAILQPIFGAVVILGIGYAFSTNRRAINWTTVAWGLGLQIVFAFIVLKTSIGQVVFETLGGYITRLLGFSQRRRGVRVRAARRRQRVGPRDDRRARARRRAVRA